MLNGFNETEEVVAKDEDEGTHRARLLSYGLVQLKFILSVIFIEM